MPRPIKPSSGYLGGQIGLLKASRCSLWVNQPIWWVSVTLEVPDESPIMYSITSQPRSIGSETAIRITNPFSVSYVLV